MEILLGFQGDKSKASFCGATRFDVNSPEQPCTVELATLFYISYLYYGKWDHANGVALRNKNYDLNTPEIMSKAYGLYHQWLNAVKQMGLTKARELKLDPLKGSDIRWW